MGDRYRFLIMSDTHGDIEHMTSIVDRHRVDCTNFFHLGDSEVSPYVINSLFLGVRGNCDYFAGLPATRDIPFPFGRVHLEHGNRYDGITDEYIDSLGCAIFLSGHTHRKLVHRTPKGVWVLNPGSLTRPRDGDLGSYLTCDVDQETGQLSNVIFHLVDPETGNEFETLDGLKAFGKHL